TLNAGAARALRAVDVHAATDVTGFGLLGHLHSLLTASGAAAEVQAAAVPLLARARELAERGAIPGGTRRNLERPSGAAECAAGTAAPAPLLPSDAQTSGGLLIALPESQVQTLRAALELERAPVAAQIGRVVAGPAGRIAVA